MSDAPSPAEQHPVKAWASDPQAAFETACARVGRALWNGGAEARRSLDAEIMFAGRNHAPALLQVFARSLEPDHLAAVLPDVWVMCEHPDWYGVRWWVDAFRRAGYVGDRPAPVAPMTVYRGTESWRVHRMSWTEDLEKARWFARRYRAASGDGAVWRATVDAAHVLARFHDVRPGEAEVVVDPRRLRSLVRVDELLRESADARGGPEAGEGGGRAPEGHRGG